MASIFSLFGEIFIDNEKANKGLEETAKKGESTGDKIKAGFGKAIDVAAKVGTAVVGAASAVATGALKMAESTAGAAKEINNMSQKLGLSREGYQEWEYILKKSGTSIGVMGTGMKTLQKQMADATAGSDGAKNAFAKLGLSAEDLRGKTPEQAFELCIKQLQEMPAGADRTAAALKLFGKGAMELQPLLNKTSEETENLRKRAHDMGLVLSDEAIDAAGKFNGAMGRIKDVMGGLKNQLGAVALEALEPIMNLIVDNIPMIQAILTQIIPVVSDLFQAVMPPILELAQELFPIIVDLIASLMPIFTTLIKDLMPLIKDILLKLLPPIAEIVQKFLPPLLQLLEPVLQLLTPIIGLLEPIIDLLMMILDPLVDLLNAILPPLISIVTKFIEIAIIPLRAEFEFLAGVIGGAVKGAFEWITNYVDVVKKVFSGIIDFIKNVFTGDWQGAWDAIKNIFSNIWEGIKAAFKIPINFIIDGINAFIRGINSIKIPDWVPGIGGAGFHINQIARLRIGMEYVPYDDFPALLHKGERVLTAGQAEEYDNMERGRAAGRSQEFNFGGLHIENFTNNSSMDIYELFELFFGWIQDRIMQQGAVWNDA